MIATERISDLKLKQISISWAIAYIVTILKNPPQLTDHGLSSGRRQAIIWTNFEILLIWTLRMNFSQI